MAGVTITMAVTIKPEAAEGFCSALPGMIKETETRPGFQDIRIVRNKEDPNQMLFVETWDTEQHYHDYIAWRTERGDMDGFETILAGAPQIAVWPTVVAAA